MAFLYDLFEEKKHGEAFWREILNHFESKHLLPVGILCQQLRPPWWDAENVLQLAQ